MYDNEDRHINIGDTVYFHLCILGLGGPYDYGECTATVIDIQRAWTGNLFAIVRYNDPHEGRIETRRLVTKEITLKINSGLLPKGI